MTESLESVVNRVLASRHDESDLLAIASAINDGQIILTSGSGSIGIGGDVVNSPTVSGSCNVIGSNNIVIQGESAMLVQALLSQQVELVHTPAISFSNCKFK